MPVTAAAIAELAAELAAAAPGVTVATDPRNVAPPCYVITPRRVQPRTVGGAVRATIVVAAVAPGVGHGDAMAWLDDALIPIWETIGRRTADLVGYESPQTGGALLAYEIEYEFDYTV